MGERKRVVKKITPSYDWSGLMPASTAQRGEPKDPASVQASASVQPIISQQVSQPVSNIPEYAMPSVVPANSTTPVNQVIDNSGDDSIKTPVVNQPSPEERPFEEGVISETVEPEWLTPKIFKGTSLG